MSLEIISGATEKLNSADTTDSITIHVQSDIQHIMCAAMMLSRLVPIGK